MNCFQLKSEPIVVEFFPVKLKIGEEQNDSLAQAVHR